MTSDIIQSDASCQAQRWLQQLQQDLLENSKNEQCQADPIYYGLMEPHMMNATDDCSDGICIYNANTACTMSVEEFFEDLDETVKQTLANEEDSGITCIYDVDDAKIPADEMGDRNPFLYPCHYEITEKSDFISYLEYTMFFNPEWTHLSIQAYMIHSEIAKDALFLTRKEANDYLKRFGYNHNADTVSYAMTAIRSPSYERLLNLLKKIDFTKSTIVLND